jgi:hypothetical protein
MPFLELEGSAVVRRSKMSSKISVFGSVCVSVEGCLRLGECWAGCLTVYVRVQLVYLSEKKYKIDVKHKIAI